MLSLNWPLKTIKKNKEDSSCVLSNTNECINLIIIKLSIYREKEVYK